MMHLYGLRPLYNSMLSQQLERCKFNYCRRGRVTFQVIFLIDEIPFKLLFGVCGYNQSFELSVDIGFTVNDNQEEISKKLCEILDLRFNPNNPFSLRAFLAEFERHIPRQAKLENRVNSYDMAPYRRDVKEPDKIYFCGWHDNVIRNQTVRKKNLDKTRKLLGLKTYETCLKKNISSCWTDDFSRACEPNLPK